MNKEEKSYFVGKFHSSFVNCKHIGADLGPLGNYPGSPFLPSDSDILLDSPEQEDIGMGIAVSFKLYICLM